MEEERSFFPPAAPPPPPIQTSSDCLFLPQPGWTSFPRSLPPQRPALSKRFQELDGNHAPLSTPPSPPSRVRRMNLHDASKLCFLLFAVRRSFPLNITGPSYTFPRGVVERCYSLGLGYLPPDKPLLGGGPLTTKCPSFPIRQWSLPDSP